MRKGMILAAACLILCFSGRCMAAAVNAASVFVTSVLPALFPMMVLSCLSEALQTGHRPRWRVCFETALFCFLSGSPASAKRLSGLVQNDESFSPLAEPMMGVCGVISPMFFLGTLQGRLAAGQGALLLLCHWASAILTGLLLFPGHKTRRGTVFPSRTAASEHPSLLIRLPGAILQSMQSLLAVLGAMMLSGIGAALVRSLLEKILPQGWQSPQLFAVLWAMLEIGGGGLAVADCITSLPLLCGLCCFGGLSIWMQCLMLIGKEIRPGKLILIRLLHGALGYMLCLLIAILFGGVIPPGSYFALPAVLLVLALLLLRRFFGRPRTCSPHS